MSQNLNMYPPMNPTFTVLEVESDGSRATLAIEPLEQGYGHTIGNSLRRVMLSSLPGYAVTSLRIDGVDHQFSTIEGMSEDVVELILNIKQLRIKSESADKGILRLTATGPAEVTAAEIECEAGFEIMNQDQHIATLAKGKKLEIEMTAEAGIGYSMAQDRKSDIVGEILIDALFSSVIRVSYRVEATRVGRRTDFDKVILQVQTDGTIEPLEATKQAAQILAKQFSQVYDPTLPEEVEEDSSLTPEEAEVLRLTVEELDLPTRISNALRKGGFKTVGDLSGAPKAIIAKVKNLGEKSVDVINEALMKKGVTLGE